MADNIAPDNKSRIGQGNVMMADNAFAIIAEVAPKIQGEMDQAMMGWAKASEIDADLMQKSQNHWQDVLKNDYNKVEQWVDDNDKKDKDEKNNKISQYQTQFNMDSKTADTNNSTLNTMTSSASQQSSTISNNDQAEFQVFGGFSQTLNQLVGMMSQLVG